MLLAERDEMMPRVVAAPAHNRVAMEALVAGHADRVYRLALHMLGDPHDAEDVRQETMIHALRGLAGFRNESTLGTWLYTITSRLCLTWRKKKQRQAAHFSELGDHVDFPSHADDPEGSALAGAESARVQRVLSRLRKPDRLLIVLKYIEGFSHDEIAAILKCSSLSSRSRLHQARQRFIELYEAAV